MKCIGLTLANVKIAQTVRQRRFDRFDVLTFDVLALIALRVRAAAQAVALYCAEHAKKYEQIADAYTEADSGSDAHRDAA